MSSAAIRVEGLSKQYTIGKQQARYRTLRQTITDGLSAPVRGAAAMMRRRSRSGESENTMWALKDVSFEVKPGEVVGIIGRNGAGKSTLLKILSRITDPTEGHAVIRGRVASLLEVGTGFHPELTGRENTYLNGAILGMKHAEIDKKFDEIVAFSGVEKFIDTPVKHYSSGMHLRLAFSVAAHLEPEIVLIDEVLAVGDAAFQKKCLGKMGEVASDGRTVIFVSHNLAVVKELCQTSMVLVNGMLEARGTVIEGLTYYSQSILEQEEDAQAHGKGWSSVRINGGLVELATNVESGDPFFTEATLNLVDDFTQVKLICTLRDPLGNTVVHRMLTGEEFWSETVEAGRYSVRVDFPSLWLAPGVYSLYFKFVGVNHTLGLERRTSEAVLVDVTGDARGISQASLAPPLTWAVSFDPVLEKQAI
jgi:lipopolysaccharide transport system ATP-binding protein